MPCWQNRRWQDQGLVGNWCLGKPWPLLRITKAWSSCFLIKHRNITHNMFKNKMAKTQMRVKKDIPQEWYKTALGCHYSLLPENVLTAGAAIFSEYININSGYITLNTAVGETGYCVWNWLKMSFLEY
jgi:hypothetical protein